MSQMHYLPLAPGFFAILVGFFFIVLILRSVRYAYESLKRTSSFEGGMSAFDPKRTSANLTLCPFRSTATDWYDALS
jgi:hypothetical protein